MAGRQPRGLSQWVATVALRRFGWMDFVPYCSSGAAFLVALPSARGACCLSSGGRCGRSHASASGEWAP